MKTQRWWQRESREEWPRRAAGRAGQRERGEDAAWTSGPSAEGRWRSEGVSRVTWASASRRLLSAAAAAWDSASAPGARSALAGSSVAGMRNRVGQSLLPCWIFCPGRRVVTPPSRPLVAALLGSPEAAAVGQGPAALAAALAGALAATGATVLQAPAPSRPPPRSRLCLSEADPSARPASAVGVGLFPCLPTGHRAMLPRVLHFPMCPASGGSHRGQTRLLDNPTQPTKSIDQSITWMGDVGWCTRYVPGGGSAGCGRSRGRLQAEAQHMERIEPAVLRMLSARVTIELQNVD
ncbi:uncharacterized protein BJ171DRAFT_477085 [Polychytrium aggregatum]|uniref:uncharacterized protein n=1 Tax=Polychytrium aggregatum TaxID=110093 RepID=UPI0022FF3403|nr:uncharacterized protein BJ171DRAFT_477085 [Polychytrium aggregatum]KAI9201993.1 hypothetical protein BJ171DRAFT_477085 [Polychytrium aggregatum]